MTATLPFSTGGACNIFTPTASCGNGVRNRGCGDGARNCGGGTNSGMSFGGTHPKGRGRGGRSLKTWICAVAAAAVVAATAAARTAAIAALDRRQCRTGLGTVVCFGNWFEPSDRPRRLFGWVGPCRCHSCLGDGRQCRTGLGTAARLRNWFELFDRPRRFLDLVGPGRIHGRAKRTLNKKRSLCQGGYGGVGICLYIRIYKNIFTPGRQPPIGKSYCTAHIAGVETSQFPLFEG